MFLLHSLVNLVVYSVDQRMSDCNNVSYVVFLHCFANSPDQFLFHSKDSEILLKKNSAKEKAVNNKNTNERWRHCEKGQDAWK